jgi:hypothetical protein
MAAAVVPEASPLQVLLRLHACSGIEDLEARRAVDIDRATVRATTFAPSIAADGSVWFMHSAAEGRRFRLYRAQWHDGHFEEPSALPFSDDSTSDVGRRPGSLAR